MEYAQIYDINRRMHNTPLCAVVNTATDLRHENKGIEIIFEEPKSGKTYEGYSLIKLLVSNNRFYKGEQVKITIRGDYPEEKLKEWVESIGEIFSLENAPRSTQEILYKSKYGHYPDEAPPTE